MHETSCMPTLSERAEERNSATSPPDLASYTPPPGTSCERFQKAMEKDASVQDTLDVDPLYLPSTLSAEFEAAPALPSSQVTPSTKLRSKQHAPKHIEVPSSAFAPKAALTVSAVLSRSGQVHPVPSRRENLEDDSGLRRRISLALERQLSETSQMSDNADGAGNQDESFFSRMPGFIRDLWQQDPDATRKNKRAGRYHTGSALEAIGALFLRQDSAGRLDQLSLNRSERQSSSAWRMDLPLWIQHIELRPLFLFLRKAQHKLSAWRETRKQSTPQMKSPPFLRMDGDDDLPETPLLMPGGFIPDNSDMLMLPPPLLDESSDAWSFEGLLGVRRMREQRERREYVDQLRKYNRPAHRVDALTAFMNFVRSAKASERRRSTSRAWSAFYGARTQDMRQRASKETRTNLVQDPVQLVSTPHVMDDHMHKLKPENSHLAYLDLAAESQPRQGTMSSSESTPRKRWTPQSMLSEPTPAQGEFARRTWPPETTTLGIVWIVCSYMLVGVAFIPDFIVFALAHTLDFVMQAFEFISYMLWFVRWVWHNVTGQTVLGRICIEAYLLFQKEWEHVIREDHEESADRMRRVFGIPLFSKPRGLSTFQVLRGFVELACIQTVTREQYQNEGAGLVRLGEWHKPIVPNPHVHTENNGDRKNEDDDEDDDDDDDMVVTYQSVDIWELSRSRRNEAPEPDYSCMLWEETENTTVVKNIKWASQLAMSAYGLRVLIVDLPPVFTPSGKQLPRQTFAHLSRLKADDVLHADIQNLDMEAAYMPTFYVVRDSRRKVVCVAVRGTQSFADIVVDLDMKTEDVTSSLAEWRGILIDENTERYAYHAGIWRAAKTLVAPGSTLFTKLCETLQEHEDFGLVFVGHSLGGAIASAAAILLSEYHIETPDTDPRKGTWRTTSQDGFPGGRLIRAITFAHPSTLSHTLNKRTSYGKVPLVVSVILGSDIIPRFGHGQLRELRRVLGALTRVRRRRGKVLSSVSSNSAHAQEDQELSVHIVRRFWDWLSICRTAHPDTVMLDKKKRLEMLFWRLRCEVENDLYAQAKRRFDEAAACEALVSTSPISPWIPAKQRNAPLHALSARRQRLDYATLKSEFAQGGVLVPAGRLLWLSDGELYDITNPMAFFSLPDLSLHMFADHYPAAYEEAILALK